MSSYKKACEIVGSIGMAIDDGLGFTVLGGQLVNGEKAPAWISELNGCDVFEIATEVLNREKMEMSDANTH